MGRPPKLKTRHQCPDCNKSFCRSDHLLRHRLNHTAPTAYECVYAGCGKSFARTDLLSRHIERHKRREQDSIEAHTRRNILPSTKAPQEETRRTPVMAASFVAGSSPFVATALPSPAFLNTNPAVSYTFPSYHSTNKNSKYVPAPAINPNARGLQFAAAFGGRAPSRAEDSKIVDVDHQSFSHLPWGLVPFAPAPAAAQPKKS